MLLEGQSLLLSTFLRSVQSDAARRITPGSKRTTALTDTPVEQSFCQRRGTENTAADCSGTLAEDRHLRGVAAEVLNIPLYPLQRIDLVEDAIIPRVPIITLLRQLRMRHKSQRARPVLHAHNHHAALGQQAPQIAAIVLRLEAAAVYPYHHGQFLVRRLRRCRNT